MPPQQEQQQQQRRRQAHEVSENPKSGGGENEEKQHDEDVSLEALVDQLDGITGVVKRDDDTAHRKNDDDVSVLIPGKISLTCRLGESESFQDKLGFGLREVSVESPNDDGDENEDEMDDDGEGNNRPKLGLPFGRRRRRRQRQQPRGKRTKVVLTDVTDASPLATATAHASEWVLHSVNRQPCTSLQQTHILVAKARGGSGGGSGGGGGALTLECHVSSSRHDDDAAGGPRLVQALVMKPTHDTTLGIRLGNTHPDTNGDDDDGDDHEDDDDDDDETHPRPVLLTVREIVRGGLLGRSVLSPGDAVVALQGKPCHDMECDDAANYLKTTAGWVSIVALSSSSNSRSIMPWWRHARRAAVGVGGGTMVGVGMVSIPTLPPPVGEVLIAGGVSMLAKEFEGPKRVVRSCRDRLKTAVGGRDDDDNNNSKPRHTATATTETEGNFENNADDANAIRARAAAIINATTENHDSTVTSGASPTGQRRNMKDRLQNFGRRHVLPFLDGVVGDQPDNDDDKEDERLNRAAATSVDRTSIEDDDDLLAKLDRAAESSDDDEEEDEDEDDDSDEDDAGGDFNNYSFDESDDDDYSWLNVDLDEGAKDMEASKTGGL